MMTLPTGWTWDRRWWSLARLMRDGEVVGEAAMHNGVCYGRYAGREVCSGPSSSVDESERIMQQVAEVAVRMI